MRFKQLLKISLVIAVLITGCTQATPTPMSTPTAADPNEGPFDIPPEIAGHAEEWPLANHDYENTRAAVASSITAANVANLQVAWTSNLKGTAEWGGGTGNPIISDGIVYFQDMGANTYAVKLATGELLWEKQYDNSIFGPSSPGIGYGKVFILSRIDRYSALDIKSGQELWYWSTGPDIPAGAFQPYVFGNQVYAALQAASSGRG